MQHFNNISAKLWPTSWSNSIHTLYRISWSASFIHLLHLHIVAVHLAALPAYILYTMQKFNYISANLWFTGWSDSIHALCKDPGSASCIVLLYACKVWPIQPLSQNAYTMKYIFAKLWPTGWSDSIHILCRISWSAYFIHLLYLHIVAVYLVALIVYTHYTTYLLCICKAVAHWLVQQHIYTI